jgi:hypothetical protein
MADKQQTDRHNESWSHSTLHLHLANIQHVAACSILVRFLMMSGRGSISSWLLVCMQECTDYGQDILTEDRS